ncbi:SIR2 family protein [Marivita sp. S0852]|uniref:SIR2 family protein n=1 Tax=Marivita sp. S0852 TaxID=3373893 RepID=UPI0039823399
MDQTELTAVVCFRPQNFAWFLGAGASRSAGLQTATDLLWDMKRQFYCREENQEISRQEMQVEAIRAKIQAFVESKGFPKLWDGEEYPVCFQKIFGDDRERQRKYIAAKLSEDNVSLSVGHRVLGAMLASGLTRAAFTTNFDSVIEKAVAEVAGKSLAAFHIEGAKSANDALNNEEYPLYCKLHGDFRYDSIKNIPQDLAAQNAQLSQCMVNAANRFGFVVTGYSGRDQSVIGLFRNALDSANPFPHGLFWTGMKGSQPIEPVRELLDEAKAKGVTAGYVPIETFDSLLSRIWRNVEGKPPELDRRVRKSETSDVSIPMVKAGTQPPLLRFNALPIKKLPSNCLRLNFSNPVDWTRLRKAQHDTEGGLVITKAAEIWAWGKQRNINDHFGSVLTSIDDTPLPDDLCGSDTLHLRGFIADALSKALARGKPLLARTNRSGSWLIIDRHSEDAGAVAPLQSIVGKTSGVIPGLFTQPTEKHLEQDRVYWSEAARISLEVRESRNWLTIDPDIWIWPPRARRDATDFLDKRKADRFNDRYNALLNAWIEIALGTNERAAEIDVSSFASGTESENPTFTIGSRTAFSRRLP